MDIIVAHATQLKKDYKCSFPILYVKNRTLGNFVYREYGFYLSSARFIACSSSCLIMLYLFLPFVCISVQGHVLTFHFLFTFDTLYDMYDVLTRTGLTYQNFSYTPLILYLSSAECQKWR